MVCLIDHHVVLAARCQREKPTGFPRRMAATRIFYTAKFFGGNCPSRKCGPQNCLVWISKELQKISLLTISLFESFQISCTKLETHNFCSISNSMCQNVTKKNKRGVSPDFLWSKFPNIKTPPEAMIFNQATGFRSRKTVCLEKESPWGLWFLFDQKTLLV